MRKLIYASLGSIAVLILTGPYGLKFWLTNGLLLTLRVRSTTPALARLSIFRELNTML
jgi:hypothetical protein